MPDDDGFFAALAFGIAFAFAFPIALVLLLFSVELALVMLLVPLVMGGQLAGLLPWVLVVRSASGDRQHVEVRGTRAMLAEWRRLRSLRLR